MDLKSAFYIAVTALSLVLFSASLAGQSGQNSYDPATGKSSSKSRDGFLDFTLKRINPGGGDYGKCIDEERALLLDESVNNGLFWSNLVALGMLGCLLFIIIYQHRLQVRRDYKAAQIMAEYEQALARSNAQIDEVIKSNHGLNSALAAVGEPALRPIANAQDSVHRASSTATQERASSPHSTPLSRRRANCVNPPSEAPQLTALKVDADIVARINLLEQQLAYTQEDNKQLRQRISESDRRLELQQQRNPELKGA